jgi:hypothetical protein
MESGFGVCMRRASGAVNPIGSGTPLPQAWSHGSCVATTWVKRAVGPQRPRANAVLMAGEVRREDVERLAPEVRVERA